MPMGIRQLQTLLNLVNTHPQRVSSTIAYNRKYKIPKTSKVHKLLETLEERKLVDNEPKLDDDGNVLVNGWRITILGMYHVANLANHRSLWRKSARKWWQIYVRKRLNRIFDAEIQALIEGYERVNMVD